MANVEEVIEVPATLTISECEEVHKKLLEIVAKDAAICIDASAVSKVDTAGVQLIASFIHDYASNDSVSVEVKVSDAYLQAANDLGLSEYVNVSE